MDPLPSAGVGGSFECQIAIQALDADPYKIKGPKDFGPYLKSVLRKSPAVGMVELWGYSTAASGYVTNEHVCKTLLTINLASEVPAAVNLNGNGFFDVRTRATVLLIFNTADPYTPLQKYHPASYSYSIALPA